MRIGMITGEYPPMQGGVGAFTHEISREIVSLGHEIHILTRKAGQTQHNGIKVSPLIGKTWGWNTLSVATDWAHRAKLDVVNVQFQTAAYDMHPAIHFLPQYMRRIPTVITFHDLRVPYLFPKAGGIRQWLVRHLAVTSSGLIATDRTDAALLTDQWHLRKVCWIPIGSNIHTVLPAEYNRSDWRGKLGIADNDLLISYFGFLNESKGALTLVEALQQLNKKGVRAHLIMIGGRAGASDPTDFAYGVQVDAAIATHDLTSKVHWSGFVGDEQVSAFFAASDITALPYRDGVSLRRGTLMAALAHHMPIITTRPLSPIPEIANAVRIVEPDSPAELAKAILQLWEEELQRTTMRSESRRAAAHFKWDAIAQKTIEFYYDVIKP